MKISNNLKEFLENHKLIIEQNNYSMVYSGAKLLLSSWDIGNLTSLLLMCNIDPFIYVDTIPYNAFYKVNLYKYTIPNNIKRLNSKSFKKCTITKLVIPKSITAIGQYALLDSNIEEIIYEGSKEDFDGIQIALGNGDWISLVKFEE